MSVRSAWPVHDMVPDKMSRGGTARLYKVEQGNERRAAKRKRKSADLDRKRNTIIARMIMAIQAGALSCTHDDARRLVHNWSDGKVKAVYEQIT